MSDIPFKPHLFVVTERRRPSFICAAALVWSQAKIINLPEGIMLMPLDHQVAIICASISEHQQHYGYACLFGGIVAYCYRPDADRATIFSPAGEIIDMHTAIQQAEIAEVRIGRHALEIR